MDRSIDTLLLLLQSVFCYCRMCSVTIECGEAAAVGANMDVGVGEAKGVGVGAGAGVEWEWYDRLHHCIECVLFLKNCVLLLYDARPPWRGRLHHDASFSFFFFFVAGYIMAPSQNLLARKRAVAQLKL